MKEKRLIQAAKVLSLLLSPLYAPLWIIIALFCFSYLRLLPWQYKVLVLLLVYVFTILIPHCGIAMLRRLMCLTPWQMSHREHRHAPYILSLLSHATCLIVMAGLNVSVLFRGIVIASLIAQAICVTINIWWKISAHMVGMGGLVGALSAFSLLFFYNPIWPFCGLLILSGMLGSSRIILRQHSLAQVLVGFAVGYACALSCILIGWI